VRVIDCMPSGMVRIVIMRHCYPRYTDSPTYLLKLVIRVEPILMYESCIIAQEAMSYFDRFEV